MDSSSLGILDPNIPSIFSHLVMMKIKVIIYYVFLSIPPFSLFLSIPPFSLFLSIPPSPYFYQFLLLLIFINSSSSLFLSIPPSPYFYQFLHLLIFINSSSFLFLSIPLPYFYQFLLIFINSFYPKFIDSSSSSNLSIPSP